MKYSIVISSEWRYRDRKRGPQAVAPGSYRVPEDVKEAVAEMALAAGKAKRVARSMGQRKTPSPQNKSLGAAPENKTTLV